MLSQTVLFLFFNAAAFLLTAGAPAAKQYAKKKRLFKGLKGRMFPICRGTGEELYPFKLYGQVGITASECFH